MPRDLESAMTLSHKQEKMNETVGLGLFLCCPFLGFSKEAKKEAKKSKDVPM
jgi:hypothetical protein